MSIETKIINTLRILSIDMIEKANSGHPGMAITSKKLGLNNKIYVICRDGCLME